MEDIDKESAVAVPAAAVMDVDAHAAACGHAAAAAAAAAACVQQQLSLQAASSSELQTNLLQGLVLVEAPAGLPGEGASCSLLSQSEMPRLLRPTVKVS